MLCTLLQGQLCKLEEESIRLEDVELRILMRKDDITKERLLIEEYLNVFTQSNINVDMLNGAIEFVYHDFLRKAEESKKIAMAKQDEDIAEELENKNETLILQTEEREQAEYYDKFELEATKLEVEISKLENKFPLETKVSKVKKSKEDKRLAKEIKSKEDKLKINLDQSKTSTVKTTSKKTTVSKVEKKPDFRKTKGLKNVDETNLMQNEIIKYLTKQHKAKQLEIQNYMFATFDFSAYRNKYVKVRGLLKSMIVNKIIMQNGMTYILPITSNYSNNEANENTSSKELDMSVAVQVDSNNSKDTKPFIDINQAKQEMLNFMAGRWTFALKELVNYMESNFSHNNKSTRKMVINHLGKLKNENRVVSADKGIYRLIDTGTSSIKDTINVAEVAEVALV